MEIYKARFLRGGRVWNALPGVVAEADTIVAFRRLSDRHIEVQGYGSCTGR